MILYPIARDARVCEGSYRQELFTQKEEDFFILIPPVLCACARERMIS